MIKIVKTDKLIGGLHEGSTILDIRELSLSSGANSGWLDINVSQQKYTIEFGSVTGADGPIRLSIGTTDVYLDSNSGWQAKEFDMPKDTTQMMITNGTGGPIDIKGIRLYPGKVSNDLIVAHPKKATETKEQNMNGWFVEMDFDLDLKDDLKQGYVIYTNTKSAKNQPFRIHNIEIQKRRIRVKADHVFFDIKNMVIPNLDLIGDTCASALSKLNRATDRPSPYTVSSNIEGQIVQEFVMQSYYEVLGHLMEYFNAKVDINGFGITLREDMGAFTGVTVEYGQNLQDIKVYENWDDVCTKLYPVGPDGLTLPEGFVTGTMQYDEVYAKVVHFPSELELETKDADGEPIDNTALLVSELRENAKRYIERNQVPKLAYVIGSDIPQDLNLWDYVQVKHPAVTNGIDEDYVLVEGSTSFDYFLLIQVTKYVYDIFDNRVTSIEYGEYQSSIRSILNKVQDEVKKDYDDKFIDQAGKLKDQADFMLNLNKLGHVLIEDNEIFILDALPKSEAKDVMRIGLGGIGFSNVGIEGPFLSAWTLDGQFSADWITAGTLEGSLLRVGSIESEHLSIEAMDMIVNLSKTGGTNLVTNSVGRGGIKPPWYVKSGTWEVGVSTWSLTSISKSEIYNSSTSGTLVQIIPMQANKIHTISFKVNKEVNAVAEVVLEMLDFNGNVQSEKYGYIGVAGIADTKEIKVLIPHSTYTSGQIQIKTSGGRVSVTDLMVDEGSGTYWTQAPNEIYGVDVVMDADGIIVQRRDSNTNEVVGYTSMTPYEFAGYYDDKKVFTLNEDITEVMGLRIGGKGLYIPPIKMVQNTESGGSLDVVWTGMED